MALEDILQNLANPEELMASQPKVPVNIDEVNNPMFPELINVAAEMDDQDLKKIGQLVMEDFESDDQSRQGWLDMHEKWYRLYFQKTTPKIERWSGQSKESIPMLTEACNQFASRTYKIFFPSWRIFKAQPTGEASPGDIERAERVSKHLSWQLMIKDPEYKRDKDRLLQSIGLTGTYFTKVYRDPILQKNITMNIHPKNLVLPYGEGPRSIESIPRKSEIIMMTMNQARFYFKNDYYITLPEVYTGDKETGLDKASQEVDGISKVENYNLDDEFTSSNQVARVIEQHRYLDLNGDGIDEPYIVTVDSESHKVLRISMRWDPTDDFMQPIEYYTQYNLIENPDGVYGLGFGHLIGEINEAVNKMLRQSIDANSLATSASGFYDKKLGLRKGEIEFKFGKFIGIDGNGVDIAKGIIPMKFEGVNPGTVSIMQMLIGRGDRVAMITQALTGEVGKVLQPTALLALIEQGLQPLTAINERLLDAWNKEVYKHYRLNSLYLDEEEYFNVMDIDEYVRLKITFNDYKNDLQIYPIADPKIITEQQKIARAQAEWQFLSQNPLTQQSPVHFYNASRRYLEALDVQDISAVLPFPQKPVQQRQDNAHLENMAAMQAVPTITPVFPDQDHEEHIIHHEAMLYDPATAARLTPAGKAVLEDHIRAHAAFLYGLGEAQQPMDVMPAEPMGGFDGNQMPGSPQGTQGMLDTVNTNTGGPGNETTGTGGI